MTIKKGDSVVIIQGKDSGKMGIIERVFPKDNKIIVQGLHVFKKHQKPSKSSPHGGIIDISMPLNASNVMLVCAHCKKITRSKYSITQSQKQRICRKCGESL